METYIVNKTAFAEFCFSKLISRSFVSNLCAKLSRGTGLLADYCSAYNSRPELIIRHYKYLSSHRQQGFPRTIRSQRLNLAFTQRLNLAFTQRSNLAFTQRFNLAFTQRLNLAFTRKSEIKSGFHSEIKSGFHSEIKSGFHSEI